MILKHGQKRKKLSCLSVSRIVVLCFVVLPPVNQSQNSDEEDIEDGETLNL